MPSRRPMISIAFFIGKPVDLRDTFSVWRRPRPRHRMSHVAGRRWPPTIRSSNAAARSTMDCGFTCQKESGGRDSPVTKHRLPLGASSLADHAPRRVARAISRAIRIALRPPYRAGQLCLSRPTGPGLGRREAARSSRDRCDGRRLRQFLVCANPAHLLSPFLIDRCRCRRIPTLPDRAQPLRCRPWIHCRTSTDLISGRELLHGGEPGGCDHRLVSFCHTVAGPCVEASSHAVFSSTAVAQDRTQSYDTRRFLHGESGDRRGCHRRTLLSRGGTSSRLPMGASTSAPRKAPSAGDLLVDHIVSCHAPASQPVTLHRKVTSGVTLHDQKARSGQSSRY